MKYSIPLIACVLISTGSQAQITITDNDMVDAGDSVRVSYAGSLGSVDHTLTDTNYVWDFSFLTPTAQERIEYTQPTSFPMNFLSDMAVTNYSPDSLPFIGQIPSNFTDYYKCSSSSFRQVGITFDLPQLTSFSAPMIFSSSDYVYRFPLNYGDVDSCDASYSLSIPGVGYIGQDRHRENYVDGWGILITPLDTYQVVRVRSVVDMTDTISLDTTNQTGFAIPRPTLIEYKWLAPGMKLPVLEIECQILFSTEVVTSIIYQDTLRDSLFQVSIPANNVNGPRVGIFPNPADETVTVQYAQQGTGDVDFVITDLSGKVVSTQRKADAGNTGAVQMDVSTLPAGIYLISVITDTGKTVSKIVIN